MKLYKYICLGAFAVLSLGALASCDDEKATLGGADDVYIEMSQTEYNTQAGDTVIISAKVSNASGDEIVTPITWSVDDESVAKLVKIRKFTVPKKKKSSSRAEGDETEGGEEDNDTIIDPVPEPEPVDTVWTEQWGVVGMPGAQGKQTRVRATLENGMYGVSIVRVNARNFRNSVRALTAVKCSYQRQANDTCWFAVEPFDLVDKAKLSYNLRVTRVIDDHLTTREQDKQFSFSYPDSIDNIYIDRENKRVGVIYTGPLLAGEGECELIVSEPGNSGSAVVPLKLIPHVSPGFEVDGHRPLYSDPTPSNIKQTLMNATMDINSTFNVGVCLGINCGDFDREIGYVYAAEQDGMMGWTVEGSAVVVEDVYADFDYYSGYVAYLRVRSGIREGLSVIKYKMADTTLTCNLTVEDLNRTYPVERIVVKQGGEEISEANFKLGEPAFLDISVEPAASFRYHKPEVVVDDESVLTVEPMGDNAGHTRTFILHNVGTTFLTITSLDKTVTIPVTVDDKVSYVRINSNTPREVLKGNSVPVKADVVMASGVPSPYPVTWHVSDASIATIEGNSADGNATLTALSEGEVIIYAEVEGVRSEDYTITVKGAETINANDHPDRYINDDDVAPGNFYLNILSRSGDIAFFGDIPYPVQNQFAGTWKGDDLGYWAIGEVESEGGSYDLVITDNGDGTVTVNGTITLPTGAVVVFENSVFIIG